MSELPEKGAFEIETIGPKKEGTSKKGNPYRTYELQFKGDAQWYNTFWTLKEDPTIGQKLDGTKSYDDKFDNYKFEIDRPGSKTNWNPAAANATVMLASVEIVNGFLSIPAHYELWAKTEDGKAGAELQTLFSRYVATVDAASKQIKEKVVGMGSLNAPEQPVNKKPETSSAGDPGPTPPPELDGMSDDETLVES